MDRKFNMLRYSKGKGWCSAEFIQAMLFFFFSLKRAIKHRLQAFRSSPSATPLSDAPWKAAGKDKPTLKQQSHQRKWNWQNDPWNRQEGQGDFWRRRSSGGRGDRCCRLWEKAGDGQDKKGKQGEGKAFVFCFVSINRRKGSRVIRETGRGDANRIQGDVIVVSTGREHALCGLSKL